MRRIIILAAVIALALGLGACGDDEPEFTEANLSKELVDGGLLEQDAADCVAASVFDELDADTIEDLKGADVSSSDDLPPELQEALTNAIAACVSG